MNHARSIGSLLSPFAFLSAAEQNTRLRKLHAKGMDERTLATLTGLSREMVLRILSEPNLKAQSG